MKNIILKINSYIKQKGNFFGWLFLLLAIEYLGLFLIETVLPGFISSIFNINFILFLIIFLWVFIMIFFNKEDQFIGINKNFLSVVVGLMILIIFVALFFSLYKTTYLELIFYLVFVLTAGVFFYQYFKEELY